MTQIRAAIYEGLHHLPEYTVMEYVNEETGRAGYIIVDEYGEFAEDQYAFYATRQEVDERKAELERADLANYDGPPDPEDNSQFGVGA